MTMLSQNIYILPKFIIVSCDLYEFSLIISFTLDYGCVSRPINCSNYYVCLLLRIKEVY